MTRISVIFKERQEAVSVRRLLKACNPEPYLL